MNGVAQTASNDALSTNLAVDDGIIFMVFVFSLCVYRVPMQDIDKVRYQIVTLLSSWYTK